MKLTANITLDELTKSQVAERKGINNNRNSERELMFDLILDIVRGF